jgi:anti-anti-sigma factor
MTIETTGQGDVAVLAVTGRIDTTTSAQLETALSAAVASATHRVVLDLAGVDFISSQGLRVLLSALKTARHLGGDVKLCGLRAEIVQIFRISGFATLFDMRANVAEAVAQFA